MYSAPRLSVQSLKLGVLPWEFQPAVPIPVWVRKDKKLRDIWINNPQTNHQCYTFNEGVNPNSRITKADKDGGGNPVRLINALVADFDSSHTLEQVLEYIKSLEYKPNWLEHTLSGHWRALWGLEEPMLVPGNKFYAHLMTQFSAVAFDPERVMPGLDLPAWKEPNKLWTNGCEWHFVHDKLIPATVATGWLMKASQSYKFSAKEFGTEIPLEVVREKLAEKFSKFKEWDTDFLEGSQGPSFWIEGSTSPKSAIVRKTGMQTFSAHAVKAFYPWVDLLGASFVKDFEAAILGRAVEDIWFDSKYYWSRVNDRWMKFERANILLELKTTRKLSPKMDENGVSLVEQALSYINRYQQVDSAGPMVFFPSGIVSIMGETRLNTCNTKAIAPAEGPPEVWGADGNFAWLSSLTEFLDPEPLRYLISWLSWAYFHAYQQKPASGQAIFICGPTDMGKTLWSQQVVGALFGGFADAVDHLTGEDAGFNIDLWGKGIWNVDDGKSSSTANKRRLFSQIIKKLVANSNHRANGKFLTASQITWLGRIICTLNLDFLDGLLMPDLEDSVAGKVMLFRTVERTQRKIKEFPMRDEIADIIGRELPHFARFLYDYQIPEDIRGENRYGVKPYHDQSLVVISNAANPDSMLAELVEMWRKSHFALNPKLDYWEGKRVDLIKALLFDPVDEKLVRYHISTLPYKMPFLVKIGLVKQIDADTYRIYPPK